MASRLAGDGFEGEPDTRKIVEEVTEIITDKLTAYALEFRLANAEPWSIEVAS